MVPRFFELHPEAAGRYPCPICARWFPRDAIKSLDGNSWLTLEDVPPKSYPGPSRQIALTCRICNHGGSRFEPDLARHAEAVQAQLEGTPRPGPVTFSSDTFAVSAYLHEPEADNPRIEVLGDKNNPEQMRRMIEAGQNRGAEGIPVTIEPKPVSYDEGRTQVALLKLGFVAAFARFGFSWAFHETVRPIRELLAAALEAGECPDTMPAGLILNDVDPAPERRMVAVAAIPAPAMLVWTNTNAILLPHPHSPPDLYRVVMEAAAGDVLNVQWIDQQTHWPDSMSLEWDLPIGA